MVLPRFIDHPDFFRTFAASVSLLSKPAHEHSTDSGAGWHERTWPQLAGSLSPCLGRASAEEAVHMPSVHIFAEQWPRLSECVAIYEEKEERAMSCFFLVDSRPANGSALSQPFRPGGSSGTLTLHIRR